MSLKVTYDGVICLSTYGFLLINIGKYMSIFHLPVYPYGTMVNFKFAKKTVKYRKLKISEIQNRTFVRTTQTKIQENFGKFQK